MQLLCYQEPKFSYPVKPNKENVIAELKNAIAKQQQQAADVLQVEWAIAILPVEHLHKF